MRILIDTNGEYDGTVVSFNDIVQTDLYDFHFSVQHKGRPKMQYKQKVGSGSQLFSLYGADFAKANEPCDTDVFLGKGRIKNGKPDAGK